jgi:hypothetical protein
MPHHIPLDYQTRRLTPGLELNNAGGAGGAAAAAAEDPGTAQIARMARTT